MLSLAACMIKEGVIILVATIGAWIALRSDWRIELSIASALVTPTS
jgi:hypothetical protein